MPSSLDVPPLRGDEFLRIQRIAHKRFGLWLRTGKEELVRTRLSRELRRLHIATFREYADRLESDTTGEMEEQFTNLLTTNHTHFFRESAHFDYFESAVLPQLAARRDIAIWCAACATGEEAYTLSICLSRFLATYGGEALRSVEPLVEATDISTRALSTAAAGVYDASRFHDIHPAALRDYLLRGNGQSAGRFRVRPEIRARVRFSQLNLLHEWPFSRPFPVIFCRNVMIYFDRETQTNLVQRMAAKLEPGGYLFVGHSESLNGIDHGLLYVQPAVYRKPGALGAGEGKRNNGPERGLKCSNKS